MPEVAATCVDSSTASAISCAVVSPYAPLYAFSLEIELVSTIWTEFQHFDNYTFGPFELEEPNEVLLEGDGDFGDVPVDEEE